jgi:hypothetical protein
VLRSPFGSAQLWQDGAWTPAACDNGACVASSGPGCPPGVPCPVPRGPFAGGGGGDLTVTPASIRDGIIYVRVPGPTTIGGPIPLSIGRLA